MNGRASFDRLRDDIEAIIKDGNRADIYRLRDLLYGEYVRTRDLSLRVIVKLSGGEEDDL